MMTHDISHIMNEVREGQVKTFQQLQKKYPEELRAYPVLLKSVFDTKFDWKIYDNMMQTKSSIDNSELTLDQGSEKVGQELVDKFVKPILPT